MRALEVCTAWVGFWILLPSPCTVSVAYSHSSTYTPGEF